MGAGFSREYGNAVFNTIFRDIGSSAYKTALFGVDKNHIGISLHNTAPSGFVPSSGEVPTAGTNYGRLYVPADEDNWGIYDSGFGVFSAYCKTTLTFNKATLSWGQMSYYGLHAVYVSGTTISWGILIGYGALGVDPHTSQLVDVPKGFQYQLPGAGEAGLPAAGLTWQMEL